MDSSNIDNEQTINPTAGEQKDKSGKPRLKPLDEALDFLRCIAVILVAAILIMTFVVRAAVVYGRSMNETLHEGDRLFLWSLFYTPKQGDIIAANCRGLNKPNGEVIIKRIIAVGGQEIDIDFSTGTVYVDGEVLEEPYINNLTVNDWGGFKYPLTVDEGHYFCMGDNRQHSTDSRDASVGLVSREDILGKAIIRFYPFNDMKIFGI